jgi:hypothetical protein
MREEAVLHIEIRLGSMEDSETKEVKLSPSIHLSFQAFEAIDLPFDLSLETCSSRARASPPHPQTPSPAQREAWREPIEQCSPPPRASTCAYGPAGLSASPGHSWLSGSDPLLVWLAEPPVLPHQRNYWLGLG